SGFDHSLGNTTQWYENIPTRRGIMDARMQAITGSGRALGDIKDGTSNTLLISEMVRSDETNDDSFGIWALAGANLVAPYNDNNNSSLSTAPPPGAAGPPPTAWIMPPNCDTSHESTNPYWL